MKQPCEDKFRWQPHTLGVEKIKLYYPLKRSGHRPVLSLYRDLDLESCEAIKVGVLGLTAPFQR